MKEPKHIHKYQRIGLGKNGYEVYKCQIPGCSHYIQPELVVGRLSLCCRCGTEITMTHSHARLVKPLCLNCDITVNETRRKLLEERRELA